MNVIPGKYKGKLASPFMLVHGVRPDQQAWLPIFSLCYFHHKNDSNALRSKNQAHALDGIIIGAIPHPQQSLFTTLATKNTTN